MFPDWMVGHEVRSIVWDDEAGTVEGDHSQLDRIRRVLAQPTPYVLGDVAGSWTLSDAAHNPADFLLVLFLLVNHRADTPEVRATLPPVFDGVEPTPFDHIPCPPGAVQ